MLVGSPYTLQQFFDELLELRTFHIEHFDDQAQNYALNVCQIFIQDHRNFPSEARRSFTRLLYLLDCQPGSDVQSVEH